MVSRENARLSFKKYAVPKERVKELKRFIRERGYKHMLEKLKKCPHFWYFFDSAYCQFNFYPDDPRTPAPQIDLFRSYFEEYHNKEQCDVPNTEEKLSPAEGLGLYYSLPIAVGTIFSPATKIYKSFEPLMDTYHNQEYLDEMTMGTHRAAVHASREISAVDGHVYAIDWDFTQQIDSSTREISYFEYKIYRREPKRKNIKRKNRSHNCYELLLNRDINRIEPQYLTYKEEQYPIYVYAHALRRVVEGLNLKRKSRSYDVFHYHTRFEDLFEYRKRLFIPVVFTNAKQETLGYFIAKIKKGTCFITTFLFVTQRGTPEGDKLSKLFSLTPQGANYLEITTYDQTVKSNIRDDEYLREVFTQCDLGHLFTIKETPEEEYMNSAAFIHKTLMIDEKGPTLSRKF